MVTLILQMRASSQILYTYGNAALTFFGGNDTLMKTAGFRRREKEIKLQ